MVTYSFLFIREIVLFTSINFSSKLMSSNVSAKTSPIRNPVQNKTLNIIIASEYLPFFSLFFNSRKSINFSKSPTDQIFISDRFFLLPNDPMFLQGFSFNP